MGRYTKTDAASLRARTTAVGTFVGWDALDARSTEATQAEDLGLALSKEDVAVFQSLAPGQQREVGGFVYFREW